MQWWNNFVEWLYSEDGWRVISGAVIPFLAIIVAGFIAAIIGRGSTRRLIAQHDSEQRTATVTAQIAAARRASKWNSASMPEQQHAEQLANEADVSTRLLPLGGATMTADWAAHEIAEMKRNSVSFSFQAEQSLVDFRDRLIEWQLRPSRAKKLFKADLDLWAYESSQGDQNLVEKQQEWAKQQVATETGPVETISASTPDKPLWETPAAIQPTTSPAEAAPTPAAQTALPAQTSLPAQTASPVVTPWPAAALPAAAVPTPAAWPAAQPSAGHHAATSVPATATTEPQPDASTTDETPGVETTTPVSANTVRQRTLPDDEDNFR